MHCTAGFAVVFLCLAAVSCSPVEKIRNKRQDEPVVIVDAGTSKNKYPFNPFFHDLPSRFPTREDGFTEMGFGSEFARRLNTMLAGLQNQFDSLWRRFYDRSGQPLRPTFDDTVGPLPPDYHNVTSTKKVVNGSVITVNETIDKQSDNNSMSFFHVKVIHVRPENPLPTSEKTPDETPKEIIPEREDKPESPIRPDNDVEHAESNPGKSEENNPDIEDNMP